MSFVSLAFVGFLLIVFAVYWFAFGRNYRLQNTWLVVAGWFFYGWWDWRFLGLLWATTLISWGCALPAKHRKALATTSVVVNLLILCVFKYLGFFGESLKRIIELFGGWADWFTIDILLPVGISFYTFQAVSYSIDVYRKKIAPCRNLITYSVYIAFFPQLVAGPIERSTKLLPQFEKPRKWDYGEAVQGMRQILWGMFKKCVIADGVAFWVQNGYEVHIYDDNLYGRFQCFLGVVGFALQIYGDFSGYSDIARGTARLFGIRLMNNFLYPFFSRNGLELWHRWHRSLMQWFTEYVYIPLGGSRTRLWVINIMIVFVLSGLWHGAAFTFIIWGLLCGIWYLIAKLLGAQSYRPGKSEAPTRNDLPKMAVTFTLFCLVFIAFRANNFHMMIEMYRSILYPGLPIFAVIVGLTILVKTLRISFKTLCMIFMAGYALLCVFNLEEALNYMLGFFGYAAAAVLFAAEWANRQYSFALERMPQKRWKRLSIYTLLYIVIFIFAADTGETKFIYFQF